MNNLLSFVKLTLCPLFLLLCEGSISSLDLVNRGHSITNTASYNEWSSNNNITICDSLQCETNMFSSETTFSPSTLLVYFPTVHIDFDPFFMMYFGTVMDLFAHCEDVHIVISSLGHMLRTPFRSTTDYTALLGWALAGRGGCPVGYLGDIAKDYSVADCQDFLTHVRSIGGAVVESSRKTGATTTYNNNNYNYNYNYNNNNNNNNSNSNYNNNVYRVA
jgi:hypothetical protein